MERSLAKSAKISVLIDGETVDVEHSQVVTFIAVGATAFKIQGSADGGSTYNDIAASAQTSDGSPGQRNVLSVYRSRLTPLKVVMTGVGATCTVVKQGLRTVPPMDFTETRNETIIDPAAGTA